MEMALDLVLEIEAKLPQTQCGQCGYAGCAPYALAIANQEAKINLCPPGGEYTLNALASLLNTEAIALEDAQKAAQPKVIAWIDEDVCIGCVACIKACPVDAILGSTKLMHTVITDECTGCELCVAPCPVDCIEMRPVTDEFLPRAMHLGDANLPKRERAADHAKKRYTWHQSRLKRDQAERKAYLATREANLGKENTPTKAAFNPMDLLAKASKSAEKLVDKAVAPNNRNQLFEEKVQYAVDQAAIRQAVRDIEYGSETKKQEAIAFLREQKQKERAKKKALQAAR